ncbi:hypothetical protein B0H12DRAFT_768822 [Mycena haematopus]|nr:hypothetical protein B0H12DRAFT_768822 [Mycena haematopus]
MLTFKRPAMRHFNNLMLPLSFSSSTTPTIPCSTSRTMAQRQSKRHDELCSPPSKLYDRIGTSWRPWNEFARLQYRNNGTFDSNHSGYRSDCVCYKISTKKCLSRRWLT